MFRHKLQKNNSLIDKVIFLQCSEMFIDAVLSRVL